MSAGKNSRERSGDKPAASMQTVPDLPPRLVVEGGKSSVTGAALQQWGGRMEGGVGRVQLSTAQLNGGEGGRGGFSQHAGGSGRGWPPMLQVRSVVHSW